MGLFIWSTISCIDVEVGVGVEARVVLEVGVGLEFGVGVVTTVELFAANKVIELLYIQIRDMVPGPCPRLRK